MADETSFFDDIGNFFQQDIVQPVENAATSAFDAVGKGFNNLFGSGQDTSGYTQQPTFQQQQQPARQQAQTQDISLGAPSLKNAFNSYLGNSFTPTPAASVATQPDKTAAIMDWLGNDSSMQAPLDAGAGQATSQGATQGQGKDSGIMNTLFGSKGMQGGLLGGLGMLANAYKGLTTKPTNYTGQALGGLMPKGQANVFSALGPSVAGQINNVVNPMQQTAGNLISQYNKGQLPAYQDQQIAQWVANQKAQLQQYYAKMGISDSSALQAALADIDKQAVAMRDQALQSVLQSGIQAGNFGQGDVALASQLTAKLAANKDTSVQDSINRFWQALGGQAARQQ